MEDLLCFLIEIRTHGVYQPAGELLLNQNDVSTIAYRQPSSFGGVEACPRRLTLFGVRSYPCSLIRKPQCFEVRNGKIFIATTITMCPVSDIHRTDYHPFGNSHGGCNEL